MTESGKARILSISAANELVVIAVENRQNRPRQICYRTQRQGVQHNEQIAHLCREVLGEANLNLGDLDALAVDLGPGSFTGQRISLAFAKGLSFALGKPLLGWNTFRLWRESFLQKQACRSGQKAAAVPLLVLIDGRKRRFYACLYLRGQVAAQWDLGSYELCLQFRKQFGKQLFAELALSGPGAIMFLEELAALALLAEIADREILTDWQNLSPCPPPDAADLAAAMLNLAQCELRSGSFMKAADGPFYLRKSDAEEQRAHGRTDKS